MKSNKVEILKTKLGLELSESIWEKLERWETLFLEYNKHTNLMSKGDLGQLFEKHVFDSLALVKCPCFEPQKPLKVLDIGTGGGFPSVILAICFENMHITAVDSTAKKINFLNLAKKELELKNLEPVCARVENMPAQKVDFILSRATAKIKELLTLSKKHFSENTKILLHKAKTAQEEIAELRMKVMPKVYTYTLPTPEKHSRCLILIKKL